VHFVVANFINILQLRCKKHKRGYSTVASLYTLTRLYNSSHLHSSEQVLLSLWALFLGITNHTERRNLRYESGTEIYIAIKMWSRYFEIWSLITVCCERVYWHWKLHSFSHFHENIFVFIILFPLNYERVYSGKINIGDLLLRHTFLNFGMVQYHN